MTGLAETLNSADFSVSNPFKGRVRIATARTTLPRIYHAAAYNEIADAVSSKPGFPPLSRRMTHTGRVLALDLGKRRIGLAISDQLGITAQGLATLERRNKRVDLAELGSLIRKHGVTQLLMGNPLHMSGTEGRQSVWVQEFANALEKRTGIPVRLWDERLTTVEASRVLRASGISIEKRAAAVDRLSAVILLQSYLDSGEWR